MFSIFRKRITSQLNTVDLVDDLEGVEMLQEVGNICGIHIHDNEAETLLTVGELYDLVSLKLESKAEFDPIWQLVCKIVREHSGSKDQIDRETTFFQNMQRRELQMYEFELPSTLFNTFRIGSLLTVTTQGRT